MTRKTFNLPDVGEGLTEAEIVQWKVAPGAPVEVNDIICEIETAKSLVELSSPFSGTVSELLVAEGETIEVGTPIFAVDDAAGNGDRRTSAPSGAADDAPVPVPEMPGELAGAPRRRARRSGSPRWRPGRPACPGIPGRGGPVAGSPRTGSR